MCEMFTGFTVMDALLKSCHNLKNNITTIHATVDAANTCLAESTNLLSQMWTLYEQAKNSRLTEEHQCSLLLSNLLIVHFRTRIILSFYLNPSSVGNFKALQRKSSLGLQRFKKVIDSYFTESCRSDSGVIILPKVEVRVEKEV